MAGTHSCWWLIFYGLWRFVIKFKGLWGWLLLRRRYISNSYNKNYIFPFSNINNKCYVTISQTFGIIIHSIVTLVSRALLGYFFIDKKCQYLAHFRLDLQWIVDCFVSISHILKILFHAYVAFLSHALLGLFFIRLLR